MKKKEEYIKAIDDISFKIYIFERYLNRYPCDVTGVMVKDRYACMLKKMLLEYERLFSEQRSYEKWEGKNYEGISDT